MSIPSTLRLPRPLLSQLRFRRRFDRVELAALSYRMPLFPYGSCVAGAFLLLVIGLMAYFPDTRVAGSRCWWCSTTGWAITAQVSRHSRR